MARLRSEVDALSERAKVLAAIACADRLIHRFDDAIDAEVHEAVRSAWAWAAGTAWDPAATVDALEQREDLDDDAVAATAFAVQAVGGDTSGAWFAVNRLVDAAFARVPYAPDESAFRPLDVDMLAAPVRADLAWLHLVLAELRSDPGDTEAIDRLRRI